MHALAKPNFELLMRLIAKHSWLQAKIEEMSNLIFDDCDNNHQLDLVVDILENLKHISAAEYNSYIADLALDIVTSHLEPKETLLVAMTADSSADSGQSVLYDLKLELSKYSWNGYKSINRYDQTANKCKDYKKAGIEFNNIVLVDNFIGTGSTVLGRVSRIRQLFSDKELEQPNIYVKTLIATSGGIEKVCEQNINLFYSIEVTDKLIERIYSENEANDKKKLMREIESKLLQSYNGRDIPTLGYGESQVAISIENKNTPNNVFPIFWWRFYQDGRERKVILHRAMDDA
ncbi:hypothetical protein [Acinetobacter lactucae]|uniref:phosphoribosyltransferase-like protein n=1 Tax=Acinetobacter lactucae TaxID=1785128 RepID=UPI0039F68585